MTTKAFAYLRTSSATNVGADKDSDKRQRSAILGFAKTDKFEVVGEFYDIDVKGADPIHTRPAFAGCCRRSSAMACARSWSRAPRALPAT
jgi:DNA invertase Pin-like site-specific DNA recombinase